MHRRMNQHTDLIIILIDDRMTRMNVVVCEVKNSFYQRTIGERGDLGFEGWGENGGAWFEGWGRAREELGSDFVCLGGHDVWWAALSWPAFRGRS